MSADIFISYRHGTTDSWVAGRLFDRLEEDFAVYFDTSRQSNDFGVDFTRGIEEALAGCRVLFAVIGPDWTSEQGMRRLQHPDDWVRRELRIALERGDSLRIVPLFVGEGAPDFSAMPDDIKDLAVRNGRPLNPDFWETESQELASRLSGEWLTVKRGTLAAQPPLPPVLPFLCNRREQEDRLVELVPAQAPSLMACVVHGHKWEAHDEFLDRLRYQGALEDILGAREAGIAVHAIQLSRDRMRDGRFGDALVSALKAAVLRRRTAADEDLRAFFRRLPQPLVAVVQLTSSDFDPPAGSPVKNLIAAWRGLLQGGAAVPGLPHPALLWINVTYDTIETDFGPDALEAALPRLEAIQSVHVREWLGLDEVKSLVAHRKHELEELPEQPRYYFVPGKVHMRTFADGVREIMSRM